VGGFLAGAYSSQDDRDFGRSRGWERLRFGEGVWGRETLRMEMGVDAVNGVDANLQQALRGTELAGRIRFRR
jgi:hypothetical protein